MTGPNVLASTQTRSLNRRPVAVMLGLLLQFFAAVANAQSAVVVDENLRRFDLGPVIEHLPDADHALAAETVLSGELDARFQPLPGGKINFGFTPDRHWFRFRLHNPHREPLLLLFELHYGLLDSIRFWEADETGGRRLHVLGDHQPFARRPVDLTGFAIPLTLGPGADRSYYFAIQTTSVFSTPVTLSGAQGFFDYYYDARWFSGLFYGVVLGLFAYNLFIWFTTRERAFLYFVLYVFSIAGMTSALDGIQFRLLPDAVTWQQYSSFVWISSASIFFLLFSATYLALNRAGPLLSAITYTLVAGNIAALVQHFFIGLDIAARIVVSFGLASIAWSLIAGLIRWRQGYVVARYYLIAFAVFLTLAALSTLTALGLLSSYGLGASFVGIEIGIAIQLILLSLALGNRINLLKEQRMQANRDALHAKAMKEASEEFFARMSHEIRTPMNGMLGMAELLRETGLDRTQSDYLNVVLTSGRSLLGIINDILDFSKLEAGHMQIELRDCNLETELNDCIAMFTLKAEEQQIDFMLAIDADTPLYLRLDTTRLRQVLLNLLGNAFKFTDHGRITMRVAGRRDGRDDQLLFQVEDTGIGIAEDARERLFDSFVQADQSISRRFGGTGLGLSICKQLVELMGGHIGVDSAPGAGSTFWFTLPLLQARQPQQLEPCHALELHDRKLLLVSRFDNYRAVLCDALEATGARVASAGSAGDAQELLRTDSSRADILVLDQSLPDMPGYELAAKLRAEDGMSDARVILVTSMRNRARDALIAQTGSFTVIDRPHSAAALRSALACVLGQAPQSATAPAEPSAGHALERAHALVIDDNAVNRMVLRGLLERLQIHTHTVASGDEALQVLRGQPEQYRLLFIDYEMPDCNGPGVARAVRDLERERNLVPARIIALSGHQSTTIIEECLQAGMDDYLCKPVTMEALRRTLGIEASGQEN